MAACGFLHTGVLLLAAFFSLTVQSGAPNATPPEVFRPASLVDGRLEFVAPVEIFWEALAPVDLIDFEVQNPPARLLSELIEKRDMFGNAEVHFEAQLTASLEGYFFYYVSENGVAEIPAEGLKGTVRFGLSDDTIVDRRVFGHVVATPPEGNPQAPGGFVLASRQPRLFRQQRSTLKVTQLVPPEVQAKWDDLSESERMFWVLDRQYSFRSDDHGRIYTFVRWTPDTGCHEACCEVRYSVFVGEALPRLLAGYAARCDI